MSDRIVSIYDWAIVFIALTAMAACGDAERLSHISLAGRADSGDIRMDAPVNSARDVLRIREDVPRNRLWVLTANEVRVYNTAAAGKRLIRTITLPSWSVVGLRHVCMPDMALDRTGSAFISSNGQARLLRIDGDRFDLKDYAINFRDREGLDIGFGALTFAADGTLYARTTPGGLLWEIDINNARAVMSKLDEKLPHDECAIATTLIRHKYLTSSYQSKNQ